jgi:hypothetical protein
MFPELLSAMLAVIPFSAVAAPFCVETSAVPPQCIYFDAASCNARAKQMQGTCSANMSELHVTAGIGHYCLLTSDGVSSCIYPDRSDCDREAKHQQGVCVDAPNRPESPGADPYRYIRPLSAGG